MTSPVTPVGSIDEASNASKDPYTAYQQNQAYWDSVDASNEKMTTTQVYYREEMSSAEHANFTKQVQQQQKQNEEENPSEASDEINF